MVTKQEIKNAILEIRNPYPVDELIVGYKDFLAYRDVLQFYQYNQKVLEHLVDLSVRLWDSQERISRASLLQVTKRYMAKTPDKLFSEEMKAKVFWLFGQVVVEENLPYNKRSIDLLKFSANNMLTGMALTDEQLDWLVDRVDSSYHVLNRLLRYPESSGIISSWAREYFELDAYRIRRAEMISWLLDEDSEYVLDMEVLERDFEYFCMMDESNMEDFEQDYEAYKAVKDGLQPVFEQPDRDIFSPGFIYNPFRNFYEEKPDFKPMRLVYYSSKRYDSDHEYYRLDLPKEKEYFYSHQELVFKSTMAWAIAYSRLNLDEKVSLLKRYFDPEIDYTFFKIGKRLGSVVFLEWLVR